MSAGDEMPDRSDRGRALSAARFHRYCYDAEKKGYSGVGIYAKRKPDRVLDRPWLEGVRSRRTLSRSAVRRLSVVSLYLPSGSSSEERQRAKFRFLKEFMPYLQALKAQAARLHSLRRLEHRAQGDRPEELALEPEELRIPAGGARVAGSTLRRGRLRRRVSARSISSPISTPGGPIAARPGRRTSGGGSTIRS